ncbi:MAG TPA: alpha/beta hydrolase [Chitinophagaceae bacterium]|nr:alpha/beta hydrolase [Chitinophagaceae bacterium]
MIRIETTAHRQTMDKEIKIEGKKIFYRVYGNGKPVMLVHGFGEMGDVWKQQVGFLKDRFQLIVPDLPGSGQSEMVEDMSMEGMAEVLKIIIEKEVLQIPPPAGGGGGTLIGHSMGGYITLAFAKKYPELLSSFGLFHSSAYADSEEKKATRRKGIEFIKEHGAFEFLKTSTPNLFSPKTKEERPELASQFLQSLSNFSPDALIAYYEAMINRPDRTEVLKNFNKPILFIMGEHDNAIPFQDSLKQSHLPSKAYIHIMHQSGHMGMLEEPEKSNQILQKFLDGI